jgi:hypothetical protein
MERLMQILKKFQPVDAIFILIALAVLALLTISVSYKTPISSKPVLLTMRVTSDVASIEKIVPSQKQVFFDSVDNSVDYVSSKKASDGYFITVKAPGSVENGRYVFDGLRVTVGEKAELHSTYFAQGFITSVRYE